MALVIPWLLVREYQQHRNALADQLSRVTGWRVVKVVIHPGELEEWARRQERAVSAQVRSRLNGVSADHVGYASGHHCLICWYSGMVLTLSMFAHTIGHIFVRVS